MTPSKDSWARKKAREIINEIMALGWPSRTEIVEKALLQAKNRGRKSGLKEAVKIIESFIDKSKDGCEIEQAKNSRSFFTAVVIRAKLKKGDGDE